MGKNSRSKIRQASFEAPQSCYELYIFLSLGICFLCQLLRVAGLRMRDSWSPPQEGELHR